jgi:hypothetical protein
MIAVVSGARLNVFAERFSRERSGLRAEPVVEAAGGELLGGTLYELAPRYEGGDALRCVASPAVFAVGQRARRLVSRRWRDSDSNRGHRNFQPWRPPTDPPCGP